MTPLRGRAARPPRSSRCPAFFSWLSPTSLLAMDQERGLLMLRRTLAVSAGPILLLLLSSLAACSAQPAETYKIGALFAVTGFNSPLGTPEKETAQMLEEQINAKGGIKGHKIKVIVYDTESDETKAVTLAKKLIEQDKVLAIIGPSSTGESLALVDTVEKAQMPADLVRRQRPDRRSRSRSGSSRRRRATRWPSPSCSTTSRPRASPRSRSSPPPAASAPPARRRSRTRRRRPASRSSPPRPSATRTPT